jgi:hypothetical protein
VKHGAHKLTIEEKTELMKELLENKARYSSLIDLRIADLQVTVEERQMDAKEFCALEKALNSRGMALRRMLMISVDGEVMWCPKCNRFYMPPVTKKHQHHSIKTDFASCREHAHRPEVKV